MKPGNMRFLTNIYADIEGLANQYGNHVRFCLCPCLSHGSAPSTCYSSAYFGFLHHQASVPSASPVSRARTSPPLHCVTWPLDASCGRLVYFQCDEEAEKREDREARHCGHISTNLRQGVWTQNPYQVYEYVPQSPKKSQAPRNGKGSSAPANGRELPFHTSPYITASVLDVFFNRCM